VPQSTLFCLGFVSIPKDCRGHLAALLDANIISSTNPPQPAEKWGASDTMVYRTTEYGEDVISVFVTYDVNGPAPLPSWE
jgi:hypothetical protein